MRKKSFTAESLVKRHFATWELDPRWERALGRPEHGFSAMIWGPSASGKTTFTLRLCAELLRHGAVFYNSLEQGFTGSLQQNVVASGLAESPNLERMKFGDRCSFDEMLESIDALYPKFLVIDSLQYMYSEKEGEEVSSIGMTMRQYQELKDRYRKRKMSIILISHQEGTDPKGKPAKAMRYDVDIKIQVQKGIARAESRYGPTEPFYIFGTPPPSQGQLFK